MGTLAYEELILLDNFVYLQWNANEGELLIDIVYDLLNNDNFPKNIEINGECATQLPLIEWISILVKILNKPNLQKLKIKDISSKDHDYVCFIDDINNITVVFRGTVNTDEWEDNGNGAYEYDTKEQIDALNYINSLKYDNIVVSGHSKGGNKAKYVTILSSKVKECVSIDGQGFSNEFVSKYSELIEKNKFKITSINAKYDYVNCLFNSISGTTYYIKTEIQLNPFDYHKASILLDLNGNLREQTNEAAFVKIINDFSESLITDLPVELKNLVINYMIDIVELILCKSNEKDEIVTVAEEVLEKLTNQSKSKLFREAYPILEILILPLLFFNDFISIEEKKSIELLDNVIDNINILGKVIIRKLTINNNESKELIDGIISKVNSFIVELSLQKNRE